MKKHLLLLATLLFSSFIFSQTRGITYQAVIYNPESNNISLPGLPSQPVPFVNKAVCLRFDIIDINSNVTYSETHATTTDQFGMVNLIIGTGKKVGGSVAAFGSIDWNRQANSLVVLLDGTANCSNFIQVSNQPFTATPFSLASGGSSSIVDASSTQKGQIQLAGDLGGTAAAPIVPGLALKADVTALNSGLATKANTSDVTTALALKAPLASPSLTGTPTAPTAPSGANTTQIATTEFVTSAVQDYVDLTSAQTISGSKSFSSNIRVGSTTPNASAALEVTSTTQGFLLPRMTSEQISAIQNPATGLMVYNITTNSLNVFVGSGWNGITSLAPPPPPPTYRPGTVHCDPNNITPIREVTSITGRIWMDRNLGARNVAISTSDVNGFGDLYQWGRFSDGHQCRNATTTTTLSSTDQPANASFILYNNQSEDDGDWRSTPNLNLWQGVNGLNNPCPTGFRIPTKAEFEAEIATWSAFSEAGAYNSDLKLPAAGIRNPTRNQINPNGFINSGNPFYWTSTVGNNDDDQYSYMVSPTDPGIFPDWRSFGASIRCIKE